MVKAKERISVHQQNQGRTNKAEKISKTKIEQIRQNILAKPR